MPTAARRGVGRAALSLVLGSGTFAADLSPARWSAAERAALERLEAQTRPDATRMVEASRGFVAGTMSPIAVRVGLDVLQQGGTAADAATAVACTQITRALGSYVSYAGIAQILYFDAKTGNVSSIDGGWAGYADETNPKALAATAASAAEPGRKTLVPGFMAAIEAMQQRFGVLSFGELLDPAIWYAENGVPISGPLAGYFQQRAKDFSRTESGQGFLKQAGSRQPAKGEKFVQADLARTLKGVARDGARYMYSGAWAERYVAAVRAAGGRVTRADLERYAPVWQEPLATTFAGHEVVGPGAASEGGYQALATLNLIEALRLETLPPYWSDAESFRRVSRVLNVTDLPTAWMLERARSKGVTLDLKERATKPFAATLAPIVETFFQRPTTTPAASAPPSHTAGIVIADPQGNVAVVVHSINTVLWGSTGLVVDGVPIPDPAAINAGTIATLAPGARVPDSLVPLLAFKDGKPVLGVAMTGSVQRETVRLVLGLLGYRADPAVLMQAPPLITANGTRRVEFLVPAVGYGEKFMSDLRASGSTFELVPPPQVRERRGVGAWGFVEPEAKRWRSLEVGELFMFASGY